MNLASISKYKVNYQEKFLQRTSEKTLDSFWSFIELKKKVILNCYKALIDEDEFVIMIFYDEMKKDSEIKDFLLKETWSGGFQRDLILLEDQIPMFLLEHVYQLYQNHNLDSDTSAFLFLKLACSYFEIPWDQQLEKMEIPHLTAFQRCHMISSLKTVYSATSLHDVGVELTIESDPTACLLDIKYDEHEKLKILKLAAHSNIEAYLRNVLVFEMCHYLDEAYVCAYIEQLNHLIRTEQDVEFKNKRKLVSIINTNITEPPVCYVATSNRLNQLYKEEKYEIMKRTGTVATLTVIVLTFIQTVF
ncbi:hypothetical protein GOBAR_AA25673 [Gossypium barbadense]|uniref:Uncharacterized protein n=1 Tax=Gossypium barbadense TaxID=3634 RepID=A0A2P5WV66_GOSBA|nr:hypothetical protein GOBAR_AA25673 [Gossypium barbadense]